ncbi:MAG: hypothetical protein QM785_00995 [Pyrinomonadaceae bacterium]
MPGGPVFDAPQSYVAFALVKLVGYSVSALFFNARYADSRANPILFGVARTALGMLLGAAVGFAGLIEFELALVVFLSGLIPFRIFEWFLTLWFFYRRSENFQGTMASHITLGIVWSFVLDIPAIIGFIATGGYWIC